MVINKLQIAFSQIETLSVSEQEYIADAILDDIKWWLSWLQSQNELIMLADEALMEFEQGETVQDW
jgi:hypothetical protein